jgi:hypothetical protein
MSDTENLGTPVVVETPAPVAAVETPVEVKVEAPVTQTWPQDWRGLISKDEKELSRLQRFTEPAKIYEAYRNLETRMSSGKFKPDLPDNPTPEQLNEYRKAVGVPEKPEGYFEKLGDGLVIGEEDKGALGLFAEALHGKNVTPDVFNTVIETAFKLIEHNQEEAVAAALETKAASRQTLYEAWGPAEYKINTNAVANILAGMPQSLRARMEGAQLADGTLMFNDVEAMKWWAQHAREMNPALGVMPAGTGDVVGGIEKELADNRNMMRTPSLWFAKENEARRSRHTQLLETLDSYKRRA